MNGFSQAPSIQWQKTYGGVDYDYPNYVKQTNDGGFILAGTTNSNSWIIKLDITGTVEWQKTFGGTFTDSAYCVQQTSEGGYIFTGSTQSNDGDVTANHGGYDVWVVKLNTLGIIEWEKTYGGSANDVAKCIKQTKDDGYIIAAYTDSQDGDITLNHGDRDYWIVKLNSVGSIEWQKTYGGSDADEVKSVVQTFDGGFIVAGSTFSNDGDVINNHGGNDYWIIKLDSIGKIQWKKTYGGSGSEFAYGIEETLDKGYVIAGLSTSTNGDITENHGFADSWIVKLNEIGTIEWQRTLGGSKFDEAISIKQVKNGGYVFVGQTQSIDGDVTGYHGGVNSDSWIVRLNEIGTIEWQRTLGGSKFDGALCVEQTTDNGFIVLIQTESVDGDVIANNGKSDFWLVKLNQEQLSTVSFNKNIMTVYPNPSTSFLYFQLPNNDLADKVIITDLKGKVVLQQTTKTKQIETDKLTSGFYIIQVFSRNNHWQTKFIKR